MTTRFKALLVPALAFLALGLALPAAATAAPGDVLQDCAEDGSLDGDYSRGELREARGQIESDFASYSDCDEIIDGQLAPRAGASTNDGPGGSGAGGDGAGGSGAGGGSGDGAGGSVDGAGGGTAEEQRQRELARAKVEKKLGASALGPDGTGAVGSADSSNGLPLPILLALIALGLLLAAGAALALGRRNSAFMGALRRVPFPRRGS